MLKGKCPKCGKVYYGWALKVPRNQFCNTCGVGLSITDESGSTLTGYSPFSAEEYKIPQPPKKPAPQDSKQDKGK